MTVKPEVELISPIPISNEEDHNSAGELSQTDMNLGMVILGESTAYEEVADINEEVFYEFTDAPKLQKHDSHLSESI